MGNWFPLSKTMMEGNADFRKLTPGEKVFWLSILSEVNLREEFYKADLEWAVALALSISKVRQARRRFQALGWLTVLPGRYVRRRRLATRYFAAKWAEPEEGVYFAPMHRYTWEQLLRCLRDRRFSHRDLVVYAFLCYFWQKSGGRANGGVFITKRQLRDATNLSSVGDSLQRLRANFEFSGRAHLFEFLEGYHRYQIKEWARWADPNECKCNFEYHAETERTLRQAIAKARAQERSKLVT